MTGGPGDSAEQPVKLSNNTRNVAVAPREIVFNEFTVTHRNLKTIERPGAGESRRAPHLC